MEPGEKERLKKSSKTKTERAETSLLSFMLSGCVSGPFVVLFSIPRQTTTGHIKHRSEQVRVCVCSGLSLPTRVCLIPVHFHYASRDCGFMDALLSFASLPQPFFSNHPLQLFMPVQGTSHTKGGHGGHTGLQGFKLRKTKKKTIL